MLTSMHQGRRAVGRQPRCHAAPGRRASTEQPELTAKAPRFSTSRKATHGMICYSPYRNNLACVFLQGCCGLVGWVGLNLFFWLFGLENKWVCFAPKGNILRRSGSAPFEPTSSVVTLLLARQRGAVAVRGCDG